MNIQFIGFGHLAKAIAKGLLAHCKEDHIKASAPSLRPETRADGIETHYDNLAMLQSADVIILAVKPHQMKAVLMEIAHLIPQEALVISIAAGLSFSWFKQQGCSHLALIRTMPNMGAQVGRSATPMIANEHVTKAQKTQAEHIFNAVGIINWVKDESLLNAYTALSGSGPAYVFLFMEAMIAAGVELGIDEVQAHEFTLQTVEGALKLARESQLDLDALRQSITSSKGTTAAALDVLYELNLSDVIKHAMIAAFERAQELDA